MRRAVLVLAALLLVAACAPKLEPTLPPASGVVATARIVDAGTLYRVSVNPSLDRLVLLFVGENLAVNASECNVTPAEVSCVVRPVPSFYEVVVEGGVSFAQGVAQRGSDYAVVTFPEASP